MAGDDLSLRIELVPKAAWNRSLHDRMKRSSWDAIRKDVLASQGEACAICLSQVKLSCHEVWVYDDVNKIQKLVGFKAVCVLCHHVMHFWKGAAPRCRGAY